MRVSDRLLDRAPYILAAGRLRWAACPISLGEALEYQDVQIRVLTNWVREGLRTGRCMRTAQAEWIGRGGSLRETAHATGVPVEEVVDILTWAEVPTDNEQ
jgi:hypothetical protein